MSTTERPKTLNFITGNPHKLAEVRAILGDVVDLQSRNVDVDEIQGSIEEIAVKKCTTAAELVGGPVLTEDTALEFTALKGLPGPYIKHFLTSLGHEDLFRLLAGFDDKSICSVCTFGYCAGPAQKPILFQGRTQGKLVSPRGPRNFGWDCMFEYEDQTYAEMEQKDKNEISHRGKALAKLKGWLAGDEIRP